MAASALIAPGGGRDPRRKSSPLTFGRALAVVGLGLALAIGYMFFSTQTISDRPNEMKTTQVILPPPPPPPPPEPKPIEKPLEPTIAPPIDQPVDTPPPPDQQPSSDPAPGDNALTAREGAGPSNYGLAAGDGSGTRIGGRPGGGGDAFRAYGTMAARELQRAAQRDGELSRGRYAVRLAVTVSPDGRITGIRVLDGGDERRNARLRQVLTGLQLSQRPPAGQPVMRIDLNARSGG